MRKNVLGKMLRTGMYAKLLLFLFCCQNDAQTSLPADAVFVPVAGNTYVTNAAASARVSARGIESWTGEQAILSSWFKTSRSGALDLYVKASAKGGASEINVSCAGRSFRVQVDQTEETILPLGRIETPAEAGYIRIDMQGLKKNGAQFANVSGFYLSGPAAVEPLYFVRNFEAYWGLRGPSVHLKYSLPSQEVEYFYNELTIPEGQDKIGSYFMANGFAEGYCGIQVNSATERRVLFSVWSPFETDRPEEIPEAQRIRLLAKGEDVHTGEFGNEGSGGQSYLVYPWQAGHTYRFLTRVRPDGQGNTAYYAWFYAPELGAWRLIAGFLRPQTDTWYKNPHSFVENFLPQQGYLSRSLRMDNQWVRTAGGEWIELTEGVFTYDATAKAQVRMDYAGGISDDGSFYLKNGGFFNQPTEYNSRFTRSPRGKAPDVAVDNL
jgi:hypothetical protein